MVYSTQLATNQYGIPISNCTMGVCKDDIKPYNGPKWTADGVQCALSVGGAVIALLSVGVKGAAWYSGAGDAGEVMLDGAGAGNAGAQAIKDCRAAMK